eukprot:SAG31_NODE_5213_length_2673_cov_2.142191_4_plen_115_part_00
MLWRRARRDSQSDERGTTVDHADVRRRRRARRPAPCGWARRCANGILEGTMIVAVPVGRLAVAMHPMRRCGTAGQARRRAACLHTQVRRVWRRCRHAQLVVKPSHGADGGRSRH